MNKIEAFVYRVVRKNPILKQRVRDIYQFAFDVIPHRRNIFPQGLKVKEGVYFGFHDVSAISPDDSKILVLRNPFDLKMPESGQKSEIGYCEINNVGDIGDFNKIDDVYAWNYHKGSRERWIDNDTIIYNSAKGEMLISKIANLRLNEQRTIPFAIDAVSEDGQLATSFSYERLQKCMPGYGYPYADESYIDKDAPEETGLFVRNLCSGEVVTFISLKQLASSAPEEFRHGYIHFVTHTEFSPDCRYVSFLHRWTGRTGTTEKRWTRLMVFDFATEELIELPTQLSGSHYVWNNKHQMIVSCTINMKSCHVLFDMNEIANYKVIAPETINSDGHPTFVTDRVFVTDTYPDRWRMAALLLVDIDKGEVRKIGALHSPKKFQTKESTCHIACDLHPRISKSGKFLSFDSVHTGVRSVCIIPMGGVN